MEAELVFESGRLSGQRFRVAEGARLTLGRSLQNDIQIPDQGISRTHCLVSNAEGLVLEDQQSSNGTLVNGGKVARHELKEGDFVEIGTSSFRVRMLAAPSEGGTGHSTVDWVQEPPGAAVRRTFGTKDTSVALPAAQDERARQRLEAFCRMISEVHAETDPALICEASAACILDITRADRAAIMLVDAAGEPQPAAIRAREAGAPGAFTVSRTVVEEAIRQGVSLVSSSAQNDDRFKCGASVLIQNIQSVMCVPLRSEKHILGAVYVDSRSLACVFGEADLAVLAAVGQQAGLALERARLVQDLENLFVGSMRTLIATIEAKDAYTRGHSERVTAFALLLADEAGISESERNILELAGVLHDVGKIAVPEAVLLKPGGLSDEEFAIIQRHPDAGARIIEHIPELGRLVALGEVRQAVRHHHERFDGKGYPARLAGGAIPSAARILAVADTFDAVTSDRPYRKGRDGSSAMEILVKEAGRQFDPECVEAFRRVFARGATQAPETVRGRFRVTGATPAGSAAPAASPRSVA